jgi:hypothetical protein
VIGELIQRSELRSEDVGHMYRLFKTHFDRVSEYRFRADLEQKQWVIRIRDRETLHGFSTLRFMRERVGPQVLSVLYSGDTIVAPGARGTTILARTWIESARRLAEHYGSSQLHWLLLVSGFRTYRLLPVFWREFFPLHSQPMPSDVRGTVDSLAGSLFGAAYSATEGIVRFPEPQPLRSEFSYIPANRLLDPHVRFFAQSNPGHANGDELVCWTRLSEDNLTQAGMRMWHAGDNAVGQLARAV